MTDRTILAASLAAVFLMAGPALAAVPAQPLERAAPPGATPQTRLTYLMMNDEKAHMTALRTELAKANSQEDFDRARRVDARIDSAAASYRKEKQAVLTAIDGLDEDQVSELVTALSSVEDQGIDLDIDADALDQMRAGSYGGAKIDTLISAYRETQALSDKAARLTVEAEVNNDAKLLKQAEKAGKEAMKKRQELLESAEELEE